MTAQTAATPLDEGFGDLSLVEKAQPVGCALTCLDKPLIGNKRSRTISSTLSTDVQKIPHQLKIDLCTQLNCACRLRIAAGVYGLVHGSDHTEDSRTSAVVSVRVCKIRVVEGVVGLQTQLKISRAFSAERDILVNLEVGVVKSGAVEEITLHIAEGANRLR